jgi:hypothetical protein
MHKFILVLIATIAVLSGCNKAKAPAASAKSGDPVQQKLQELAGGKATDCGRVAQGSDMKSASDCAMQAAQGKKPFYVAYDMPGMTVAIAGAADGKLYTVQTESAEAAQGGAPSTGAKGPTVVECPAELRVAQSGRVTCFPPGGFMGAQGANPHGGGMSMPMPPSGTPNPHGGEAPQPNKAH